MPMEYEPDPGAVTKKEQLESVVFQALGTASLCWIPKPAGVFDSQTAKEVGDALVEAIRKLFMLYPDEGENVTLNDTT